MALQPSVEEQEHLADTFARAVSRMTPRERVAEAVGCVAFAAAMAGLWLLRPPQAFALAPAAICLLVLVLATMVRFETPFGFTVPTQLAFVPLLFTMPMALVPVAVATALLIARIRDVFRGHLAPSRLPNVFANSLYAFGPAAVFAIADVAPRSASAALLAAALLAQFVVDFGVSTVLIAIERSASFASQLRESWVYAIDAGLAGIGLVVAEEIHRTPLAALALLPLLALIATFAHERHHRLESLIELNNAYRGTALVLGDVVEADDGYTGEHCKGVVELTLAAAEKLNLEPERRRNLEFAALLHDVGKIAIPKEIINKPGTLDPEEWAIVKTHTLEGQKMLERVGGFMRDVGLIVRSHHERWDGTGYPDGLAGAAIPLEARIIACCDTWNAMRTDRPYRKALSYELALTELLANAGSQFDPAVVQALILVVNPLRDGQAATVDPTADRGEAWQQVQAAAA